MLNNNNYRSQKEKCQAYWAIIFDIYKQVPTENQRL